MNANVFKEVVSWFDFLRNKMFYVNLEPMSIEEVLKNALLTNRASCLGKHILLGRHFAFRGFDVEYLLFPFRWAELVVDYPNDIKSLAGKLPATQHVAVNIRGREESVIRFVDATWDPPLSGAGFHINSLVDGFMENAVIPCGESQRFANVGELIETRNKRLDLWSDAENRIFRKFYALLNAWLDSVRATPNAQPFKEVVS